MKDIIRFSLVLCLICFVSGAMLALIYGIAEPRIVQQQKIEEEKAIQEVLPRVPAAIEKIELEDYVFYRAKDADNNIIAYVIIAQTKGYADLIKVVAALSRQGKLIKVKVLDQYETPGVGTQIVEDKFLSQFEGKLINEQFDTITGATISSQALIDLIKEKSERVIRHEK